MRLGDNVYVHGYVDEIRNGTVIIRNEGGYFGTVPSEIIDALDRQPTIKAIPIKWLRSKMTEYVCNGKYSSDQLPIVYTLIYEWEKENETVE